VFGVDAFAELYGVLCCKEAFLEDAGVVFYFYGFPCLCGLDRCGRARGVRGVPGVELAGFVPSLAGWLGEAVVLWCLAADCVYGLSFADRVRYGQGCD
jgi:hypothetical protein